MANLALPHRQLICVFFLSYACILALGIDRANYRSFPINNDEDIVTPRFPHHGTITLSDTALEHYLVYSHIILWRPLGFGCAETFD
jgi:hypothetical protein